MFFPFGLLLALLYFRKDIARQVSFAGFGFSFLLETLQYMFRIGYSDTGDLIANTVGAALGAQAAVVLMRRAKRWLRQAAVYACVALTVLLFIKLDVGPTLLGSLNLATKLAGPTSGATGP